MTEPYTKRLLSADSHIVEPPDLWLTRMDKKWRDKAPRIEALDESGDYIIIDGLHPPCMPGSARPRPRPRSTRPPSPRP